MISINLNDLKVDEAILFKIASFFSDEEGTFFLYSGGDYETSRYTFLFLFPYETCVIHKSESGFEELESKFQFDLKNSEIPLWVGFFSYDMAVSDQDSLNEFPNSYFQKSACTFVYDKKTNDCTLYINQDSYLEIDEKHRKWAHEFEELHFLRSFIENLPDIDTNPKKSSELLNRSETKEEYENKIYQIQEMIKEGDVYQVNLSQQLTFQTHENPFIYFYRLSITNPAPFSSYFKIKEGVIVSSSPERFLKKERGFLETRPIKGTSPRGKTSKEDQDNKMKLLSSKKNLAELLMITDLMRNDLGKISTPGSVKTIKQVELESYSNVFHLLSIIQSQPIPSLHPVRIIKECFPGGSITGCPKWMAMKVIRQLENRTRGIYTGSIGYFKENGDFDFNIAIRTCLFIENEAYVQLGGAITIDSNAEDEYEETLHKGKSIFYVLDLK